MRRKIGTVIAVRFNDLPEVYLADNGAITPNIAMAKNFRASGKVLDTIRGQVVTDFPQARVETSLIERWEEK